MLGEKVGETVGYTVRFDSKVSKRTRVEVVTEGVLARRLLSDPALEGVACVVFDEFHERSLDADLCLALCLQAQELLRPESLRLVVMSATLGSEAQRVAALLGKGAAFGGEGAAPVVTSEGKSYPVRVEYARQTPSAKQRGAVEDAVAAAVLEALSSCEGDALVFLPGAAAIRGVRERLERAGCAARVMMLHGTLSTPAEQDEAINGARSGERRVVLATPVAESSLTVKGVRIVVDSGLARAPVYSSARGMEVLLTEEVAVQNADQRAGRAGREASGVCFRLWTPANHARRLERPVPEIQRADLAPLALALAAWGETDVDSFAWLDRPREEALCEAAELLRRLGALGGGATGGGTSALGDALAATPAHPRLAAMLAWGAAAEAQAG